MCRSIYLLGSRRPAGRIERAEATLARRCRKQVRRALRVERKRVADAPIGEVAKPEDSTLRFELVDR
jgi:hypothetical protein